MTTVRRIGLTVLALFLVLTLASRASAQRQRPPEYKEIVAASQIEDAAARLKEFERIKTAYPSSGMMDAIDYYILSARIDLADTLKAVLSLQKPAIEAAHGPDRLGYLSMSAEKILDHPRLKSFPPAGVTAAVLDYQKQAVAAAGEASTFAQVPPDQRKFVKDYYLSGFDILAARAYLNQGDPVRARASLGSYQKDGGQPRPEYSYTLAEVNAKQGRDREALDNYLAAALDNYEGAADKARALYARLKGSVIGFEAVLEAKVRELPYKVEPYRPSPDWKGQAVLAELFTGSECPPCLGADLGFDGLLEAYPESRLAILEYHLPIPRPDPMMNPATKIRQDYYGINSAPTVVIGGDKKMVGGGSRGMSGDKFKQYAAEVDARVDAAPGLELKAKAVRSGDTVKVVCGFDPTVAGAEYNLVLVEGEERYKGGNGVLFHKNVVRALARLDPSGSKEAVFDLAAVEKATDTYLTDFEKTYERVPNFKFAERHSALDRKALKVVFFVQDRTSHKVLNAVVADVE
jgi:thiol-disulfide isomerase/thioredoxin